MGKHSLFDNFLIQFFYNYEAKADPMFILFFIWSLRSKF